MISRCFLLSLLIIFSSIIDAAEEDRKMYIIYMGSHLPSGQSPDVFYNELMTKVIGSSYSEHPSEYLLYTYQRSFYGCVAMLTNSEAQQIVDVEGVVSIFENKKLELQTTRSWDFMGFPTDVQRSEIERDVIVGVLDTGIWPESASFSDEGLSAVPSKWKGICQTSANFSSCNKKIIGARFYKADKSFSTEDGPSPRDFHGHGTHTASTVAGALVPKANFFGLGSGIARGGVPAARIAVYKVCWVGEGCSDADILSAFDDAISDGVDIISMSVGGSAIDYQFDTIAIGAFHAMQHGILASLSAGNSGPSRGTVGNTAPWLMSVAASTTDRKFVTDVHLENGQVFRGARSLNPFDPIGKKFSMIYGGDAPNSTFSIEGRRCSSLNRTLVEGKIVVCEGIGARSSRSPLEAGAAGVVIRLDVDDVEGQSSSAYPLPITIVPSDDGDAIISYMFNLSNVNPEGTILRSDIVKNKSAPNIASFSSRGPNPITPTILKPDMCAPGVDILAAYSPEGEVSLIASDTRSTNYKIISGTSMACPHASASAAYVKSFHPDWSPASIRSALMTTAFPLNSSANTDAELAYGAGHINPKRAVDPGLVYNATEIDYVNFLCSQGYNASQIARISSKNNTICPSNTTGFTGDLNYPSITVATETRTFDKTFLRRLTSVTEGPNYPYVYKVKVNVASSSQVTVKVEPETLRFTHPGHELSYTVHVKGGFSSLDEVISTSVEWLDGVHKVRSPVVIFRI